jgi:patatin-like phospholipase/acyl hydrolase
MGTSDRSSSYRILALDGGGIRGLMTAIWLERLESELGRPIREDFDLIAGTSTGGIIACGLVAGLPASRMVSLYRDRGRDIFPAAPSRLWNRLGRIFSEGPSAPKYSDEGLARVLKQVFEDRRLAEVPKGKLLLVTSYDTEARNPLVLKSTKREHENLRLWEVAKATSSAPTFFPAHVLTLGDRQIPLIDGGVVANNPTACAIAEAVRMNEALPETGCRLADFVVASFGTGDTTRPISAKEAREWGVLEWALPIIEVLMDGANDAVDYVSSFLVPKDRYFRVQTPLARAYDDLDRADATNLAALTAQAEDYLERGGGGAKIKQLAALLKQQRRA